MSWRAGYRNVYGPQFWAEVYVRIPFRPRTVQVSWARGDGWTWTVIHEHFRPYRPGWNG